MFNCMTVQPVMAEERVVFYRERASSYYSSMPYAVVRPSVWWLRGRVGGEGGGQWHARVPTCHTV